MTTFPNQLIDETSPFPDGQPHISSPAKLDVLRCRIASPLDLLNLALLTDVYRGSELQIMYLMGSRMDRRLSPKEPYTLRAVCRLINSLGWPKVSVFCPHSQATTDLLENYCPDWSERLEKQFFGDAIMSAMSPIRAGSLSTSIVFPDEGASKRFGKNEWVKKVSLPLVTLAKRRDERTGKILGIEVYQGTVQEHCIILDDLCDGGATFIGAAKALRDKGAKRVSLVVAHGIFSKGIVLEGIDFIYTTDSFKFWDSTDNFFVYRIA